MGWSVCYCCSYFRFDNACTQGLQTLQCVGHFADSRRSPSLLSMKNHNLNCTHEHLITHSRARRQTDTDAHRLAKRQTGTHSLPTHLTDRLSDKKTRSESKHYLNCRQPGTFNNHFLNTQICRFNDHSCKARTAKPLTLHSDLQKLTATASREG